MTEATTHEKETMANASRTPMSLRPGALLREGRVTSASATQAASEKTAQRSSTAASGVPSNHAQAAGRNMLPETIEPISESTKRTTRKFMPDRP